jgi:hypothetical protein
LGALDRIPNIDLHCAEFGLDIRPRNALSSVTLDVMRPWRLLRPLRCSISAYNLITSSERRRLAPQVDGTASDERIKCSPSVISDIDSIVGLENLLDDNPASSSDIDMVNISDSHHTSNSDMSTVRGY